MYAVVSSGGKQYRVEAGSELIVERIAGEPGASVTFDRVLLIGDGDDVTVGTPTVSGASVSGTLLREELGPKLVIFKFKQKVKYRRRTGHRQHLMRVRIDEINASGKRSSRPAEAKTETKSTESKAAAKTEAAAPAEKPARKPRAASARTSTAASKASASAKSKPSETKATTETEKPKRKPRAKATADKPAEE
jgi:large subunit ribosomal protein L21